nr:hypothetical protein [Synechococcus sp. RedBA-s]
MVQSRAGNLALRPLGYQAGEDVSFQFKLITEPTGQVHHLRHADDQILQRILLQHIDQPQAITSIGAENQGPRKGGHNFVLGTINELGELAHQHSPHGRLQKVRHLQAGDRKGTTQAETQGQTILLAEGIEDERHVLADLAGAHKAGQIGNRHRALQLTDAEHHSFRSLQGWRRQLNQQAGENGCHPPEAFDPLLILHGEGRHLGRCHEHGRRTLQAIEHHL